MKAQVLKPPAPALPEAGSQSSAGHFPYSSRFSGSQSKTFWWGGSVVMGRRWWGCLGDWGGSKRLVRIINTFRQNSVMR